MLFLDDTGLEHLWAHIVSRLGDKVDKVDGKGLSSEDYTTTEKQQLQNLNNLVGDTAVSTQISSGISNAIAKKTVQLTTSGWSSNQQTVNVSGVTANNLIIVSPDPATSNYSAYTQSEVRCTAQSAGKLTFTCKKTPSAAITVNVAVLL